MMAEDEFKVEKNGDGENETPKKVFDEADYNIRRTRKDHGPAAIGQGGDPLFKRIHASKEQLMELMEETQVVQDWVQRETSNNVALACLNNENLKELYFQIKDGFGDYGRISLMGFKTPTGVEIPRLKIYDKDGNVLEVLTGPLAIDEINRRAIAYRESLTGYEELPFEGNEAVESAEIGDYTGNIEDYS